MLRFQPETTQWVVRLIVYSTFAYLGMMLAMRSNRDEFSLIIPYVRFTRETMEHESLVLDTSVIIDGRIADLCATGFISRSLIVPRFVLSELQALADSREPMKRDRGRRGLDILNQLQNSREIELTIHESESGEGPVDERLVRTAKLLQARLLTNDNALGQVARLQQVPTLNLNDLTLALRPTVAAGDELELQLVKEGRLFARWYNDRGQSGASKDGHERENCRFRRAANRGRPFNFRGVERLNSQRPLEIGESAAAADTRPRGSRMNGQVLLLTER